MKSASMIRTAAAATLALALLLAACGRERSEPSTSTPPAPAEDGLRKLHVLTAEGQAIVTFRWDADEVQILINDEEGKRRFLRSKLGDGRQRRWNERGVGPVALVRTNEKGNAFSILSVDGKELWWRVRLGERVALVRDHPDKPGFDLRQERDRGVQVTSESGSELGRVEIVPRSRHVRVFDPAGNLVYKTARNAPVSMLYGVLLAPDLEPMAQYLLMAELLVR